MIFTLTRPLPLEDRDYATVVALKGSFVPGYILALVAHVQILAVVVLLPRYQKPLLLLAQY